MKEGLFFENNELIFYKNDQPYHAGVIKVDGAIYYISSKGRAVKGRHTVHRSMSNDILKRGTYTFGDDYKLVENSYIAPKKKKRKKSDRTHKASWKHFFKKNKRIIISFEIIIICIIVIGLCLENSKIKKDIEQPENNVMTVDEVILPQFTEDVLICSIDAKKEYDGQESLKDAVKTGNPYRSFQFEYQLPSTQKGILLLSEDSDFKNAKEYNLVSTKQYIEIDNLKTGTEYYYKVIVNDQEYKGSFRTAESTRFVSIPNLYNTRDIGGYMNQEGRRVRQGLLIRGVEFDGLVNSEYYLPDEQIKNVQDTFDFVYDFDLRTPDIYSGEYSSRLDIPHKFYSSPTYGEIFYVTYKEAIRKIFSDLADSKKYPMYLHCTWGADRTGTIVFLLQGLLNLSEKDMIREYEQTGYVHHSFVGNGNMDVIINGLQGYEGDTLQEKIHTFLVDEIGVSESDIESIQNIFLE